MKKRFIFSVLLCYIASMGLGSIEAIAAKRLSQGRSIGYYKKHVSRPQYGQQRYTTPSPTATTQPNRSSWVAPAAGGLLTGLGVGALYSHLSSNNNNHATAQPEGPAPTTDSNMLSSSGTPSTPSSAILPGILIIALVLSFAYFMRKKLGVKNPNNSLSTTHVHPDTPQTIDQPDTSLPKGSDLISPDISTFLAMTQKLFADVQHAFDQRDKNHLVQHVSPNVFQEMEPDLLSPAQGEVSIITLQASFIEAFKDGEHIIASVYFHGQLREENQVGTLSEIWHLKNKSDAPYGWIIEGIEQSTSKP